MTYDNDQEAATLWYHDHALGITRLNVYAGLPASTFYKTKTASTLCTTASFQAATTTLAWRSRTALLRRRSLYYPAYKNDPLPGTTTPSKMWFPKSSTKRMAMMPPRSCLSSLATRSWSTAWRGRSWTSQRAITSSGSSTAPILASTCSRLDDPHVAVSPRRDGRRASPSSRYHQRRRRHSGEQRVPRSCPRRPRRTRFRLQRSSTPATP